jgi:tetratricopeptide (TPR) repeat protein
MVQPGDRWPSMTALLDALEAVPRRRRLAVIAAAALLVASGLVTAAVLLWPTTPAAGASCRGAGDLLTGVWDDARRDEVRTAFAATGRPYAADTFQRTAALLDRYAGDWTSQRTTACEATRVRQDQSESLLDLRMHCLDQKLTELDQLAAVLGKADAAVLDQAVQAGAALSRLDACADPIGLTTTTPLPGDPAQQARIADGRRQVAEAKALLHAGKYADGLKVALDEVDRARAIAFPPLLAETLEVVGRLRGATGAPADAETALGEAARWAADAHNDELAATIWIALIDTVRERGDLARADTMYTAADAAVARAGKVSHLQADLAVAAGDLRHAQGREADAAAQLREGLRLYDAEPVSDPSAVVRALKTLGAVATMLGEHAEARAALERGLRVAEQTFGPVHPATAAAIGGVGVLHLKLGELDEARRYMERALAVSRAALGPDNPTLAVAELNLGGVLIKLGHLPEARQHLEAALVLRRKALGDQHPGVARILANLGTLALMNGDLDQADQRLHEAATILENKLGPAHPELASLLLNLAEVKRRRRDYAGAMQLHERILAIQTKALGAGSKEVADEMDGLGQLLQEQHRWDEALRAFERSLAIRERLGPDSPLVAESLVLIADVHFANGRVREAEAAAERATAIYAAGGPPQFVAEARFTLARSLWLLGRDRPRALALAHQARDGFAAAGAAFASDLAKVDAWLARRPG